MLNAGSILQIEPKRFLKMPSIRINKQLNEGIYFLTFTVKRWYYLFDRHNRWDILLKFLKYCQKNKGLLIYNWVFMLNHIHLIVRNVYIIGFVRDFKTFTSKELKRNILATEPNILNVDFGDHWVLRARLQGAL